MRVLVAILNWGLGHATRSVPVIDAMLAAGMEPWLASDGQALQFLRKHYPELPALVLPAYGVRYRFQPLLLDLALQTPRIARAIVAEHHQVRAWVRTHKFQAIVSDSRFGCFHTNLPSVIISHQLQLPLPGWQGGWVANAVNARLLQQFSSCWVPDAEHAPGLSGALSHQSVSGPDVQFVGLLSRFGSTPELSKPPQVEILALLSGPEPARSKLEAQLLNQLPGLNKPWLLLRGLPGNDSIKPMPKQGAVADFLGGDALAALLQQTPLVIARSGYSTVMDLAALRKQALLIPTPGQHEQMYLGHHLANQQWFLVQQQLQLNLATALHEIQQLRPLKPLPQANPQALRNAIQTLKSQMG